MRRIILVTLLAVLPAAVVAAEGMARVITDGAKPVQCIAPIEVYNIDGKLVRQNAMGFDLEPGHSAANPALRRVNSPVEVSQAYFDCMTNSPMVDMVSRQGIKKTSPIHPRAG
jgi:hypothetical protein